MSGVRQAHHERCMSARPEPVDGRAMRFTMSARPEPVEGRAMRSVSCALLSLFLIEPVVIQSTDAIPAHIAGRFREASGFQQSTSGQYFVFDRRSHVVFGIDSDKSSSWEIVHIGAEAGRIIDPTAFAVAPDGSFAVADAPENRERIQIFTPAGFRTAGFTLPQRQ